MAKAINNNIWYQEVAPRSFYDEEDLERAIIQNIGTIFPQFNAFLFKKSLYDPTRKKWNTPDLAMVKFDYSEWYIIEVELGKHNKNVVLDQIRTFYNCNYDSDHATYMHRRKANLDLQQLNVMIASIPPDFMVIVNEQKNDWVEDLRSLRCKTCIFEIYHDLNGNPLYRLNGEHPYIYTSFCHCRYQKVGSPYTIEVLDRYFLDGYGISDGHEISIEFKGLTLKWTRQDGSGRVFLHCNYSNPPLDSLSSRYKLNYNEELNSFSFTKD